MNDLHDLKMIDIDIRDEMKKSYIDYAMSVIVSRALPDVRDGLKPVHRRILFAMNELNFTYDRQHRKSARIVGEVLGKYHPHGDSSVYNAMVRMAQEFSMRELLIDGHGNFGSIDGDSAAAMRYTEARMTKLASELLKDIEKDTVNFTPNFDGSEKEPVVLPARFPNLLINGSSGIAVGMATSIPPHNLREIIDATVHVIDEPDATVDDLLEYVKGPDFPTSAMIMGVSSVRQAYRTGRGKAIVRSRATIEEHANGKSTIIITEIPYMVNKAKMLENFVELVRDKKIEGITDLRDESNREGIRVVVELKRDTNANVVLNQLYKHTQLQSTFSINMIALVNGQPKIVNLLDIIKHYISFQKEVETRRVQFDLNKALDRAHILEGLVIALDNIDEVIQIIRNAYNDAEKRLMERFDLSDIQAKSIVDMRLRRLQGLEREKIENEYNELLRQINYFRELLADELLLLSIIKEDLLRIKQNFGDERRTEILYDYNELDMEDLIDEEMVTITLTHHGYIKRVPIDTYSIQKRGGKGKTGLSTREEDFVIDIYTTSTHDYMLFFTNFGKVYRMKAYQVPEGSRLSKGTAIVNLLPLEANEKIAAIRPVKDLNEGYLVLLTKHGIIKKSEASKFDTSRKSGLIAINLKEGDELIGVKKTTGNDELIVITANGKSIRFMESNVRDMGRLAMGVKAIDLSKEDYVVSLDIVDLEGKLLVMSENGYGKRTIMSEYRLQTRGGKGIKTSHITEKTGHLIGACVVSELDEILLINSEGVVIRIKAAGISTSGRSTSGVRLMKFGENETLKNFTKLLAQDIDEEIPLVELEITEQDLADIIESDELDESDEITDIDMDNDSIDDTKE